MRSGLSTGFNSHLNDPIQLILKEVVSLLDILQLIAVGDQRLCIDFARFDEGNFPCSIIG